MFYIIKIKIIKKKKQTKNKRKYAVNIEKVGCDHPGKGSPVVGGFENWSESHSQIYKFFVSQRCYVWLFENDQLLVL